MGFLDKLKNAIMGGGKKVEKAGKDVEHGAEKTKNTVEHKSEKAVDDTEEKS